MKIRMTKSGAIVAEVSVESAGHLVTHLNDQYHRECARAAALIDMGPEYPDWDQRADRANTINGNSRVLRDLVSLIDLAAARAGFRLCIGASRDHNVKKTNGAGAAAEPGELSATTEVHRA